jgi:hypothetical protein
MFDSILQFLQFYFRAYSAACFFESPGVLWTEALTQPLLRWSTTSKAMPMTVTITITTAVIIAELLMAIPAPP